jgi:hypothetical protein
MLLHQPKPFHTSTQVTSGVDIALLPILVIKQRVEPLP